MIDRIDEILAICDRVFGPDEGEPVPTSLIECMPGPHRPQRPHDTYLPDESLRSELDAAARTSFRRLAARYTTPEEIFSAPRLSDLRRPSGSGGVTTVHNLTFGIAQKLAERGGGKLCNNTRVIVHDDGWGVILHRTEIFRYNTRLNSAALDSGGYETVTTKQRLNALLQAHGFRVYADKRSWYVKDSAGYGCCFEDGMSLAFS